jgi:hypothetical protein
MNATTPHGLTSLPSRSMPHLPARLQSSPDDKPLTLERRVNVPWPTLSLLQVLFPVYTSARQALEASPDFVEFRTFYKSQEPLLFMLEAQQAPITLLAPNNAVRVGAKRDGCG